MMRILIVAVLLCTSSLALAVPRMSLPAGAPCATCHHNPVGGGGAMRWASVP